MGKILLIYIGKTLILNRNTIVILNIVIKNVNRKGLNQIPIFLFKICLKMKKYFVV